MSTAASVVTPRTSTLSAAQMGRLELPLSVLASIARKEADGEEYDAHSADEAFSQLRTLLEGASGHLYPLVCRSTPVLNVLPLFISSPEPSKWALTALSVLEMLLQGGDDVLQLMLSSGGDKLVHKLVSVLQALPAAAGSSGGSGGAGSDDEAAAGSGTGDMDFSQLAAAEKACLILAQLCRFQLAARQAVLRRAQLAVLLRALQATTAMLKRDDGASRQAFAWHVLMDKQCLLLSLLPAASVDAMAMLRESGILSHLCQLLLWLCRSAVAGVYSATYGVSLLQALAAMLPGAKGSQAEALDAGLLRLLLCESHRGELLWAVEASGTTCQQLRAVPRAVDIQAMQFAVVHLIACLQLRSSELAHRCTAAVEEASEAEWQRLCEDETLLSTLPPPARHASLSITLTEAVACIVALDGELLRLRRQHFDDDVVHESLAALLTVLSRADCVANFFVLMPGAMTLLVDCCNNIVESVMLAALRVALTVLLGRPAAQLLFVRCGGIWALADCMRDYNVAIRSVALQCLSALLSTGAADPHALREAGILLRVLHILRDFPADDVSLAVLHYALDVLAHCLPRRAANQEFVLTHSGLELLLALLDRVPIDCDADSHSDAAMRPAVLDGVFSCLANMMYRCTAAQAAMCRNGGLRRCWQWFVDCVDSAPVVPLASCLNAIINGLDTNWAAQELLGDEAAAAVLRRLLRDAASPLELRALVCLLLSHLVWNHEDNQKLFSCIGVFRSLLKLACSPAAGVSSADGEGRKVDDDDDEDEDGDDASKLDDDGDGDGDADDAGKVDGDEDALSSYLTRSQRQHRSADRQPLNDCQLYATMALTNLCFHNQQVQDMALEEAALDDLLGLLQCDASRALQATAAFCVGNLIEGHDGNRKRLCELHGVPLLLALLNDDDEDELSKKAFVTLQYMGSLAVESLVSLLSDLLPAADVEDAEEEAAEDDALLAHLAKLLAVLNGLLYTSADSLSGLPSAFGLRPLITLLARVRSLHVRLPAVYVLANLTVSRKRGMQQAAVDLRAVELLVELLADILAATGDSEARAIVYCNLHNLCFNLPSAVARLLRAGLPVQLLGDCTADDGGLRAEAIGLLLAIADAACLEDESGRAVRSCEGWAAFQRAGLLSTLAAIAEDGRVSSASAARAEQCLRELRAD